MYRKYTAGNSMKLEKKELVTGGKKKLSRVYFVLWLSIRKVMIRSEANNLIKG
jgi:hypothetical protein